MLSNSPLCLRRLSRNARQYTRSRLLGHGVTVLTAYLGPLTGERRLQAVESDRWGWRTESGGIETVYLRTRLRYRTLTLNPSVTSFCRKRLREFDIVHVYGLYDLLG